MNVLERNNEKRYNEYVFHERERIAPLVGEKAIATTIFLNFVAPGLLEAPAPRTELKESAANPSPLERPLGNVALFRQIARPEAPVISDEIFIGHAEFSDAA